MKGPEAKKTKKGGGGGAGPVGAKYAPAWPKGRARGNHKKNKNRGQGSPGRGSMGGPKRNKKGEIKS